MKRGKKKSKNCFLKLEFKRVISRNLKFLECPNKAKTDNIKYVLYLSSDLHFTDSETVLEGE